MCTCLLPALVSLCCFTFFTCEKRNTLCCRCRCNRVTPTNKLLFKQKLTDSNLCNFCSMHIETLQHLFWECMTVQTFWTNLKNKCNNLNINIKIDLKSICFGEVNNSSTVKANNYILFYAKYYIFICKCRKNIPILIFFKVYLSTCLDIIKQI